MSSVCETDPPVIDQALFPVPSTERIVPESTQPADEQLDHLNVETHSSETVTLVEQVPGSYGHDADGIIAMGDELDQCGSEITLTGTLINEEGIGSPTIAESECGIMNGCGQESDRLAVYGKQQRSSVCETDSPGTDQALFPVISSSERIVPESVQPADEQLDHLQVETLSSEIVTSSESVPGSYGPDVDGKNGMGDELDQHGSEITLAGTLINERIGSPTTEPESGIMNGCGEESDRLADYGKPKLFSVCDADSPGTDQALLSGPSTERMVPESVQPAVEQFENPHIETLSLENMTSGEPVPGSSGHDVDGNNGMKRMSDELDQCGSEIAFAETLISERIGSPTIESESGIMNGCEQLDHLHAETLSVETVTSDEPAPGSSGHDVDMKGVEDEFDQCGSEITLAGTLINERIGSPTVAVFESAIMSGCGQESDRISVYEKQLVHYPEQQSPLSDEAKIGQVEAMKGSQLHPGPKPRRKLPVPARFKNFPVYRHRQQITDKVRLNPVTLISGPTGSGKSALIPLLLDNDADKHKERCSIVVAMPRRIAAVSLCGYVCQETKCREGAEVGYQIGMVRAAASSQTRILYCTVGILLQRMMRDSQSGHPLSRFTHIILDEVHERSEDIDFTMMLVKLALDAGEPYPKLVIMSATMNSSAILCYFKDEHLCVCPPLIRIVDAPLYPVKEVYLEEMSTELGSSLGELNFDFEKPFAKHDLMNLTLAHIAEMHRRTPRNAKGTTTLIFLPGLEDIEKMIDKIHCDYADKLRGIAKWEICPLHSLIPQHIQSAVFLPVKRNVWRIVVASGIAESSITVPEVERVYDFCLTKNMVTDDETKLSYLQIQWATKSSCDQRKGRAGRTRTGTVYRLVYEDFFSQLADHPDPEILNVPVTKSILRSKMLKLGLGPVELMEHMISPPARDDVIRAVQLLKEKGALSLYHVGQLQQTDGDLTFLGNLCATLPLSVPLIRLIFLTFCCGLIDDGIVLACIISVQSIFQTTWMDDTEGWISKKKNDCGLRSDCLASFRIFRAWVFQSLNGQFGDGQNSERERLWCMQYRLSRSRMQEIMFTVNEIRRRLSNVGLYVENANYYQSKFEPDKEWEVLMKMAIAGAFYPDYMIHSPPEDKTTLDCFGSSNVEELARFGGFNPLQCVEVAVPTRSDTISAVFYESLLRQYIRSILRTEVFPSITYLRNRAVVCLEQGVGDVAGQGSLLVEQLLRSTKKQRRRNSTAAFRIPSVRDGCVDAFNKANPDVAETLTVKGTNCWVSLDYSLWHPEIPQATVLAYNYGDFEFCITATQKVDSDVFFARLFPFGPDPLIQLNKELQALLGSDLVRKCLPSDKEESILGKYVISYMGYPSEQIARAKVVRIENDNIEVYLIDYGQTARLPWNRTFIVLVSDATRCFWETPKLAVKCRLADGFSVPPLRNLSVFDRLQQETAQLVVMVSHSKNGLVVLKNIFVLTESGRESLSVRMLCDEHCLEFDTELDSKVQAANVTTLKIPAVKVKAEYTDTHDITFGNPVNSYDIGRGGYRWLYPILRFIEAHQESVNAVLLRSSVPDPVDYVLVSCETVVSKRKNMVVCADTTLMPHVPGMAAILGMMYAPVVEMRIDPETGLIVGVFCGLGAISRETDAPHLPLFAAHDCMIFADGVIDQADVESVRNIRETINTMVSYAQSLKSQVGKMDGEVKENLQKRQTELRHAILMLLQKKRGISVVPKKKGPASVCARRWLSTLPNNQPARKEASVDRITYELH